MGAHALGEILCQWGVSWRQEKGSFWWRDVQKLLTTFKGLAQAQLHDGKTI